jgi:outer membrane protein assembly factor BamB
MQNGLFDGEGPRSFARAAWRFDLKLPKGAVRAWRTFAEPLIVGDVVVCAALDGSYYGLDAKKGRVLWSLAACAPPTRGGLLAPVRWDGGQGAGALLFTDDAVLCVDPTSGAVLRRYAHQPGSARPAVAGSTLLLAQQRSLVAMDLGSGEERTRVALRDEVIAPIATDTAGSIALVKCLDGTVSCVDLARGKALWHRKHARTGRSSLALNAERVFCPGGERSLFLALDLGSGELAWSRMFDTGCYGASALDDSTLLCSSFYGKKRTQVHALDERTGELRWSVETDGFAGGAECSIARGSSRGYAVAGTSVVAFDLPSGVEVARAALKSSQFATIPVIAGGLMAVSTEHHVLAYR